MSSPASGFADNNSTPDTPHAAPKSSPIFQFQTPKPTVTPQSPAPAQAAINVASKQPSKQNLVAVPAVRLDEVNKAPKLTSTNAQNKPEPAMQQQPPQAKAPPAMTQPLSKLHSRPPAVPRAMDSGAQQRLGDQSRQQHVSSPTPTATAPAPHPMLARPVAPAVPASAPAPFDRPIPNRPMAPSAPAAYVPRISAPAVPAYGWQDARLLQGTIGHGSDRDVGYGGGRGGGRGAGFGGNTRHRQSQFPTFPNASHVVNNVFDIDGPSNMSADAKPVRVKRAAVKIAGAPIPSSAISAKADGNEVTLSRQTGVADPSTPSTQTARAPKTTLSTNGAADVGKSPIVPPQLRQSQTPLSMQGQAVGAHQPVATPKELGNSAIVPTSSAFMGSKHSTPTVSAMSPPQSENKTPHVGSSESQKKFAFGSSGSVRAGTHHSRYAT